MKSLEERKQAKEEAKKTHVYEEMGGSDVTLKKSGKQSPLYVIYILLGSICIAGLLSAAGILKMELLFFIEPFLCGLWVLLGIVLISKQIKEAIKEGNY